MKNHILRSAMVFAAGALVMGAATYFWPQPEIKAAMANGNDKFTMVTVPLIETGELEGRLRSESPHWRLDRFGHQRADGGVWVQLSAQRGCRFSNSG